MDSTAKAWIDITKARATERGLLFNVEVYTSKDDVKFATMWGPDQQTLRRALHRSNPGATVYVAPAKVA